jgi:hypothetical protein
LRRCLDAREAETRAQLDAARHDLANQRQEVEARERDADARVLDVEARARDVDSRAHELDARAARLDAREVEIDERQQRLASLQQQGEEERIDLARHASELRVAHDAWRAHAIEWQAASARAEALADTLGRQLRRLQAADRDRLRQLVNGCLATARARRWSVAVFGAGLHTEWLLRETALRDEPRLQIFDSSPEARGGRCGGLPVYPAADIARAKPDIVIVSSLAFRDEMAAFVEGLGLPDVHVLCCYPE